MNIARIKTTSSRYTLIIVATLFSAMMMGILVFTSYQQNQTITILSEYLNATREQVKDAGNVPVSPPAKTITETPVSDLKGPKGDTGEPGRELTRTEVLTTFGIYCTENNCIGAPGKIGPTGDVSTVEGPPGADSTVMGPPGADSTVAGPPGADSTVAGPKGETGTNGEPPFSWVVTRTLVNGAVETESCVREEPFDKETPKYTCTVSSPPIK